MNDELDTSKLKAPYATVRPFSEILDKSRQYQLRRIDADTLGKWGYSQFDISSSLSALKFLNIIDGSFNTTDNYGAIRSDIKYESEMRRIVETAYGRLFNLYDGDLASRTRKDIEDSIILDEAYPGTAKKSAPKAAAFFVWLCQQAGINFKAQETHVAARTEGSSSKPVKKKEPPTTGKMIEREPDSHGFVIALSIDPMMTEEEVYQLLRKVSNAQDRIRNDYRQS